ncbi:hypothetical protein BCR44DRAFT_1444556, partial [Catenaria anguillulae PL171]
MPAVRDSYTHAASSSTRAITLAYHLPNTNQIKTRKYTIPTIIPVPRSRRHAPSGGSSGGFGYV